MSRDKKERGVGQGTVGVRRVQMQGSKKELGERGVISIYNG